MRVLHSLPPHRGAEPIAIVGFAGRWPSAPTPSSLETLLFASASGRTSIPAHTFTSNTFTHPSPNRAGSVPQSTGYFLPQDPKSFDAAFFGINPTEARTMDPAQRQLLEVSYECFESAGLSLSDVAEKRIGCFIGNHGLEYAGHRFMDQDFSTQDKYGVTGCVNTLLSNRLSYVFNLRGPSFTIDTACSSTMYALHTACNSLEVGDCDSALVGAVNLIFGAFGQMDTATLGALSPSSTCHTFDADADGYARAEGVGALYVKRLSDAVRDGDCIRAVIRGTAVNANGKTGGISYPSPDGQEAVIRAAYKKAGIENFGNTGYFECHGTGTPVGDPLEVQGIGQVFASARTKDDPLLIGSVKTNIGHSESASGMSAIFKAVFSLERDVIPSTIGVRKLNPKVNFDKARVKVVTENSPLPTRDGVKRISINNFGFGGANAHAIIESVQSYLQSHYIPRIQRSTLTCPAVPHRNGILRVTGASSSNPSELNGKRSSNDSSSNTSRPFLLTFSSQDSSSLSNNITAVETVASQYHPADIARTLSLRSRLYHRAFTIASPSDSPISFSSITTGKKLESPPRLIFVFTGQGAQYQLMGASLLPHPTFAATLRQLNTHLRSLPRPPSWDLNSALSSSETRIHDPAFSQTLCTALQIALTDLLSSFGITPSATVGHSSGEIGAAYAAGILTREEAITIAYYRGFVVEKLNTDGAMLAVGLGVEEVRPYLEGLDGIRIACINSPQSVTLSGDRPAIESIHEQLLKDSVFSRALRTGGRAYHSSHMKAVGTEYEIFLRHAIGRKRSTGRMKSEMKAVMVSSVYAEPVTGPVGVEYWRKNLESPVMFHQAVSRLHELGAGDKFLEIGPHSALEGPLRQIRQLLGASAPGYLPTLIRNDDAFHSVLQTCGKLFLEGININLTAINAVPKVPGKLLVDLPGYQWNHDTVHWEESTLSANYRFRKHPRHDLLGSRIPYGGTGAVFWRNLLKLKDCPWIKDHQIQKRVLFPAAGYISMVLEAATQMHELSTATKSDNLRYTLSKLSLESGLVLDEKEGREMLLSLDPSQISSVKTSKRWFDFRILSAAKGTEEWAQHCNGRVAIEVGKFEGYSQDCNQHINRTSKNTKTVSSSLAYRRMYDMGLCYGPEFRRLLDINWDSMEKKIFGYSDVSSAMEHESRYLIHPAGLDTALQLSTLVMASGNVDELKGYLPVFIEELTVSGKAVSSWPKGTKAMLAGWAKETGVRSVIGGFMMEYEEDSGTKLEAKGVRLLEFDNAVSDGAAEAKNSERCPYMRVIWKPDVEMLSSHQAQKVIAEDMIVPVVPEAKALSHQQKELASLVDLYTYKNSGMRILQLDQYKIFPTLMDLLNADTNTPKFWRYTLVTETGHDGHSYFGVRYLKHQNEIQEEYRYHLIINGKNANKDLKAILEDTHKMLWPGGRAILPRAISAVSDFQRSLLEEAGFEEDCLLTDNFIVIRATDPDLQPAKRKEIVIVHKTNQPLPAIKRLRSLASSLNWNITETTISDPSLSPSACVLSLVDLGSHAPLLETINDAEMAGLQKLTSTATSILWLTSGGSCGLNSAGAMMGAFARSVTVEEPRLRFVTVDLEDPIIESKQTLGYVQQLIEQHFFLESMSGKRPLQETEYAERKGLLCVPRELPDLVENFNFNSVFNTSGGGGQQTLVAQAIGGRALRMELGHVGQPDSLFFVEDEFAGKPVKPGFVEIEVKVTSINNKDVMIILGMFDAVAPEGSERPCFFSCERAGVVTRVGDGVDDIKPGDRVVAGSPGWFSTFERVPAYTCLKLEPEEDFKSVASLLVVYATVVYSFNYLARLEKGESVLIHAGAGGVGIAAITLAQAMGCKVYTTVSNSEKRIFLREKFGLSDDCIFNSRDRSFAKDLARATGGKGVDVILSAQTGDLMHESWNCLAPFGRFVDIGREEVLGHGRLDMAPFSRDCAFYSFDLAKVVEDRPKLASRIYADVMALYREGTIHPISPLTVFPVSDLAKAFRFFTRGVHMGKLVIDYDDPTAKVMCRPTQESVYFEPAGSYIIIGGMGGLGRALIEWMLERGARNFVLMARSGAARYGEEAKLLIQKVEAAGGRLDTVKGDATDRKDIQRCVDMAASYGPIKGAINSAMIVGDALFSQTSAETCRNVVNVKHLATRYLHDALLSHTPDFFLPMSSISGALGPLTQSTYAAANAAMDSFARYRHSLGLPCVSLALGAISEVGHLHEHNEVADKFRRIGLYPMNQAEFLQAMETAMRLQMAGFSRKRERALLADDAASSYLLTGLDSRRMNTMVASGYEGGSSVHLDLKFSNLANALKLRAKSGSSLIAEAKEASSAAVQKLYAQKGREAAVAHTAKLFIEKLSALLLVPVEQFDTGKSLVEYGMDSMVGSELRVWLYREFAVDVSFLEISIPTRSIKGMIELVFGRMGVEKGSVI